MRSIYLAASVVVAALLLPATANATVTISEKIQLQATVKQAVDRNLVDGKFYYFDAQTSKIEALYPAKPHPKILSIGDHFIVCADFRKRDGKTVNVDFFLTRQENGFVLFDTVVGDREPIDRLMLSGQVRVVK